MVVFSASGLPPASIDYERLLNVMIFCLDEFVENDYTVVMLMSGAQYHPGWQWLTKAYRRLDRKYRKNVKRLYVVHPSAWTKLVFQIFGKIVSPKFFAKVTWVDTLSQLATMVPLSQISVPAAVHAYNAKVEGAYTSCPSPPPSVAAGRVFGVPLESLMGSDAGHVVLPRPVRECIGFLRRANGTATEGIFRRSPASTQLRAAKNAYNEGSHVDLAQGGVHVAAVLLKLFFRELPTPVFGTHSYAAIRAMPATGSDERARHVTTAVLSLLPRDHRLLLCFVCALLADVARNSEANRMTPFNLALVWAPNLARSESPANDVAMCAAGPQASTVGGVVQIMITCFDSVFESEIKTVLGTTGGDCVGQVLCAVDRMNLGPLIGQS
ncbi:hypothetical protein GGI20_004534 [Coemansia sp. BCRC 34301]|nr:hypothetical protein GGI20_004534 [Coemansia sp. BCRC 34301]